MKFSGFGLFVVAIQTLVLIAAKTAQATQPASLPPSPNLAQCETLLLKGPVDLEALILSVDSSLPRQGVQAEKARAYLEYMRKLAFYIQSNIVVQVYGVEWLNGQGVEFQGASITSFEKFLRVRAPDAQSWNHWIAVLTDLNITPSFARRNQIQWTKPKPESAFIDEIFRNSLEIDIPPLMKSIRAENRIWEMNTPRLPPEPQGIDQEVNGLLRILTAAESVRLLSEDMNPRVWNSDSEPHFKVPFQKELISLFSNDEKFDIDGFAFATFLRGIHLRWSYGAEVEILKFVKRWVNGEFAYGKPGPIDLAKVYLMVVLADKEWQERVLLRKELYSYLFDAFAEIDFQTNMIK